MGICAMRRSSGCGRTSPRTASVARRGEPFKSQAQRRKFAQLLVEGKISNETFEEWNRETGRKKLPEREAKVSAVQEKGWT